MPKINDCKVYSRNEDTGVDTPLPSHSVEVWSVVSNTLYTTVTSNTDAIVTDVTVSGAVGDKFRLRVLNDGFGRCSCVTVLSE